MGLSDDMLDDDRIPASDLFNQFLLAQAMRNMRTGEGGMWPPTNHDRRNIFDRSTWELYQTSSASTSSSNSLTITELERIREGGNRCFAEGNWGAAVKAYSRCIDLALLKLDSGGPPKSNNSLDNVNNVLLLAYSNRAEAWLRVQHYEDGLSDADKALQIDPKHVKTLFRKGKAAHGLGLFEKSCKAFEAALEESPGERSIKEHLKASATAWKQSLTGEYDLTAFYLADSDAEPPTCADFVGPVEIRRVRYGGGRRGLFATRDLKAGELLLVSNPLAVAKLTVPHLVGLSESSVRNKLVWELVKRATTSKRHRAQLYSLCRRGDDYKDIPPMELFRAGSEWVPEGSPEKFEIDIDQISEIVGLNATSRIAQLATSDGRLLAATISEGIWAIPSLFNHSCSPNVFHYVIGDALFFRASMDIVKGEELTWSYLFGEHLFDGLFEDVEARRAAFRESWLFLCKCPRCLLEENLQRKLAKVKKAYSNLMRAQACERLRSGATGQPANDLTSPDFVKLVDEVEAIIRDSKLVPREQGWIRALFLVAYIAKFGEAMTFEGRFQASAGALILDSTTAVGVSELALGHGAMLLETVEQRQSKHSRLYRQTLDIVLGVYRLYFGNQPEKVLLKLIKRRGLAVEFCKNSTHDQYQQHY